MLSAFFQRWRKPVSSSSPSSLQETAREEVRAWQKVLAEEHGRLSHDLTELLATYERSLQYFSAHVQDLDAESLQKEYQSLEGIRSVLANAVRRLEVSTKDNRDLLEEWQEWQAIQETATRTLEPAQQQRREMVRSELAIRGKLPLETARSIESVSRESSPAPDLHALLPKTRTVFVEEAYDNFDDWHDIYTRELEAAQSHWQERLEEALNEAPRDPAYAAAVIARVRTWHGDRKQFRKK